MYISKRNRRAVIWLVFICLGISITPRILAAAFETSEPTITFERARELHRKLREAKAESKREIQQKKKWVFKKPKSKFDPKEYKLTDWIYLGLSPKQAVIAKKFSDRGVASEQDLKRIFVISDELFTLIKDSVIYSKEIISAPSQSVKKEIEKVEIGTATEEELMTIPGIGSFFTKQIIKRRNDLGGFVDVDQLLEVYKIDNEKLEQIKPYLILDSTINQLNINTSTSDVLRKHPYIDYHVANSIVKYRKQHGDYTDVKEIEKSALIDHQLYLKLAPYLTCK